ncbi:hypothetical protein [Salinimicrobium sp. HB62]|uniref:hypothetical protein n=1 Tax=Salinimicrobium sp. HB62 TaxID=3077781 RepID=UPI002D79D024|nr:hypothetical protein [Salinimicrobium sp. HB62]
MKTLFSFAALCLGFCYALTAQTHAVTDTGQEVLLYSDGTYAYVNAEDAEAVTIPTNPEKFTRSENASFLLKSKRMDMGFYLDPKLWSFGESRENPDAEYEVVLKGEDLYGVIITEKIEVPLETLKNIAVENARQIAPDIRIVEQEYRTVNNQKVLYLRLDGTMDGMKISYSGYFYSDASGTVQFITFTAQNLVEEYKEASQQLINGLVKIS